MRTGERRPADDGEFRDVLEVAGELIENTIVELELLVTELRALCLRDSGDNPPAPPPAVSPDETA